MSLYYSSSPATGARSRDVISTSSCRAACDSADSPAPAGPDAPGAVVCAPALKCVCSKQPQQQQQQWRQQQQRRRRRRRQRRAPRGAGPHTLASASHTPQIPQTGRARSSRVPPPVLLTTRVTRGTSKTQLPAQRAHTSTMATPACSTRAAHLPGGVTRARHQGPCRRGHRPRHITARAARAAERGASDAHRGAAAGAALAAPEHTAARAAVDGGAETVRRSRGGGHWRSVHAPAPQTASHKTKPRSPRASPQARPSARTPAHSPNSGHGPFTVEPRCRAPAPIERRVVDHAAVCARPSIHVHHAQRTHEHTQQRHKHGAQPAARMRAHARTSRAPSALCSRPHPGLSRSQTQRPRECPPARSAARR